MVTGAIKNKVDKIWTDLWAGGITNPLTVIEQLTYLMFIRSLDEKEMETEELENMSGEKLSKIFPQSPVGQAMRWSRFKNNDAREIYEVISQRVFPAIKNMKNGHLPDFDEKGEIIEVQEESGEQQESTAFARYMSDAMFLIPTPQVLQKIITGLDDLYEHDLTGLDVQGDLYEYKLGKLATAGQNGQFRTPKQIREMMVELIAPTPDDVICEKKANVPKVKEKISLIREIGSETFWEANDILLFERVRRELRSIISILVEGENKRTITTSLSDPVMEQQEGVLLDQAYDFEDYRQKVNRYVEEHGNQLVIHKLKHNLPLTEVDYRELEHILTVELGSREDYRREFGDTPFGLLIRKIAKLDHDAAMQAFSQFINDQSLTQSQIAFVHKVIHYVEQNGYMESVTALQKPPFDKPVSFLKLFNNAQREQLLQVIHSVKSNAENVTA